MWITKILLLVSAIGIQAEISGLSELSRGYSYDQPQSVPAELAFYLNIPAGHDASKYIGKPKEFLNHYHHQQYQHQQFNGEENHIEGHSHFHQQPRSQYIPPTATEGHSLFHQQPSNQYIPQTPVPDLPFLQQTSGFRPIVGPYTPQPDLPFIEENKGLNLINSDHHHDDDHQDQNDGFHRHPFASQFEVEPRSQTHDSHQNTLNYHHQHSQNSPVPSQSLQPPPSLLSTHSSSDDEDNELEGNNRFMASISGSYNAPLPFAFGVVPIKFDPLPLKTHLRQEKLLPITSYEAKLFYKK